MTNPKLLWLAVVLTLLTSLLAVPTVTGAQESLTESFTWTAYPMTVRYPLGWTIFASPNRVSFSPADRDVTDGAGPELVLFYQPDTSAAQLDSAAAALRSAVNGSASPVMAGQMAGYDTRAFDFTQLAPVSAQGRLVLIALDAQTVVGLATIVRAGDLATYLPVLEGMIASLSVGAPGNSSVSFSSSSAGSVQLPQVFAWRQVGLTFAFPQNWMVDASSADQITAMIAQPTSMDEAARTIGIYRIERQSGIDLRAMMQSVLSGDAPDAVLVDVTVSGMSGVTAKYSDHAAEPAITLRTLLLDVPEHNTLVLVVMGSTERDWPDFRPIASAFTGSISPLTSGISAAVDSADTSLRLISASAESSARRASPPRQGTEPQPYEWEEMGISLQVPADWQILPATRDYDLALVSPLAMQGGAGGFVTFRSIPFLAEPYDEALASVAESMSSTVETYSAAGVEGVRVFGAAEVEDVEQWLVLLPYGEDGEALYMQAVTPPNESEVLQSIFDTMEITPLKSDADAINAAWQASLAENGTLVYGDPDAPIHIVEFLSFTCGHCANFTAQIERLIALEVEGDEPRVRFEIAPVMWDEYAQRAASALYCAVEQGQGYSAYKALFHGYLNEGYDVAYTDDGLTAIMTDLGLDTDAFATCMSEKRYDPTIAAIETRFRDSGISATPTLAFGVNGADPAPIPVGNGEIWSGAIPLGTVRNILTMLIEEGIPLAELFAEE